VTDQTGRQEHFPDAGQVDFDAESAPDEAHVGDATGPQETAAPPVGPEGPYDEAHVGPDATGGADGVGGDTVPTGEEESRELDQRVAELTTDLQRLQAEYLNYKRRVDRDRELVVQNARLAVLTALLPALDDVDRAREHEELSGGFKAVAEALERVVAGAGLEKFGAQGDEFDPRLHEALMHGHSAEVTTTVCDKVFQAGYRMGDRVVRAAKVTVLDPEPG
jgi:molecular chaperone GrpE